MNNDDYVKMTRSISSQNQSIKKKIKEINEKEVTNEQLSSYKTVQIIWLESVYNYLYYTYYFALIILGYLLLKRRRNQKKKMVFLLALIAFPYVIGNIEIVVYETCIYIWTFILCVNYEVVELGSSIGNVMRGFN